MDTYRRKNAHTATTATTTTTTISTTTTTISTGINTTPPVAAAAVAPPRALDDEESNFLQGVEAQRLEARQRKDDWEAEELRGFALARANQTGASPIVRFVCVCVLCDGLPLTGV